jgi:hypothetical protein
LQLSSRTMRHVIDHFVSTYEVGPDYFSTRKFAGSVGVSGLIIHDEGDLEVPYQYAQVIHQAWKRSKLITTKGLGHNLKSVSVVNEVLAFISEHTQQPVAVEG